MLDPIKLKEARKLISEELQDKMKSDYPSDLYTKLCLIAGELDVLIKKLE